MKKRTVTSTVILATVACLLVDSSYVFAAKGGIKGPPEGGESAVNRLSMPAVVFTGSAILANWTVPEGVLGVDYSYGCGVAEKYEEFSYPNTSCVDNLMEPTTDEGKGYYTAEECTDDVPPSPCAGQDVSRIYWQKDANNFWSADVDLSSVPVEAAYLNWGDALEAVSWTSRSKIRVETQPHSSTIPGFNPTDIAYGACVDAAIGNPMNDCKVGFQMWHVSGQGITEQWGVRATEERISYNYDSPFQIINTPTAMLNIAKMEPNSAVCPSTGGGEEAAALVEGEGGLVWDNVNHVWLSTNADVPDPCTWRNDPYSIETSVSGKYVYGYNWDMKNVGLTCGVDWQKTGWWRLTFYTTNGAVKFSDAAIPTSAPPDVPAEARALPRTDFNTAVSSELPPAESDALYTPVVDTGNNLTYLDICIVAKDGSSGGKVK